MNTKEQQMIFKYNNNDQTIFIEKNEEGFWTMDLLNRGCVEGVIINFENSKALSLFISKVFAFNTTYESLFCKIQIVHTRSKIVLLTEEIKNEGDESDEDEVAECIFQADRVSFINFLDKVKETIDSRTRV